jgi:chemotaxis signal transduction protein
MGAERGHEASGSERSSRRAGGSQRSSGRLGTALRGKLCAFWLEGTAFGIDVGLVGEIVQIERLTAVPLAPLEVLGLFNLRGVPVPLVDTSRLLRTPRRSEPQPGAAYHALVIRHRTMSAALWIDRMELVLSPGLGRFTAASEPEDIILQGFLEAEERRGLTVSVLDPEVLLDRIYSIRSVRT